MLRILNRNVISIYPKIVPQVIQTRSFWEYVNMMFNKLDTERLKQFGPDRTCAEWVLRNGGKVVWENGMKSTNYNLLPPEKMSIPKLTEIDATDSSISHYGFPHLIGCTKLHKIILHNCGYIDDKALNGLEHARSTLTHLQISHCKNVTDKGLKGLTALDKLETLALFNLISVENLEECKQYLGKSMPKCKIQDAELEMKA